MDTKNVKITCDVHEEDSGIPELIEEEGIEVSIESLKIGDYYLGGKTYFERKTMDDFLGSLYGTPEHHIYKQLRRGQNAGLSMVLIIEGTKLKFNTGNMRVKYAQLASAQNTIKYIMGIPIVQKLDKKGVVKGLIRVATYIQTKKHTDIIPRKMGIKEPNEKDKHIYYYQGFENTGIGTAQKIADIFDYPESMMNWLSTIRVERTRTGNPKGYTGLKIEGIGHKWVIQNQKMIFGKINEVEKEEK